MYTIKDNNENIIEIKNSKFITSIFNLNSLNDIDKYLKLVKDKYQNATHYCYAYIYKDVKKASDDGEPGGTAGTPILQVLEKRQLNFILCVVTRYFGGIKLGAGGLVRAYTKSVSTCLDNSNILKLVEGFTLDITFNYDLSKKIDYLLKDSIINNKSYKDVIIYNVSIEKDILDKLKFLNININNIENTYIKK